MIPLVLRGLLKRKVSDMRVKKSQVIVTLCIGLGCSIFIVIISLIFSDLITSWEYKTLDYRFKLRGDIPTHPDIVLIDIDDESMKAIGRWPWDRSYHGRMIDILTKSGVAAIGYDVLFDQPAGIDGDRSLINATINLKNLYYPLGLALRDVSDDHIGIVDGKSLAEELRRFSLPLKTSIMSHILNVERGVVPFKGLLDVSEGAGHISSNRDMDGTIRRVPLVVNLNGSPFPAFGLGVASAYLQVPPDNILLEPGLHLLLKGAIIDEGTGKDEIRIPIDDRGMMVINYAGRWNETFIHYSFIDILKGAEDEKGIGDLKESLKGKICIVSNTATGYDLKPTPVEESYPGGGIHANIINTIVTQKFLRESGPVGKILILLILTIGASWLTLGGVSWSDWKISTFSFFLLISTYWVLSYVAFSRFGFITEMFLPSAGMILSYSTATLYARTVEQRQSARLTTEMEQLGRELRLKSAEFTSKEDELLNLREEFAKNMSDSNRVMLHDEESIQKIAILEARVESVLKEKDILLHSRQQLEKRLSRILSGPVHSEYQLEGKWEDLQKECAGYGLITRSMKLLKIFEQVKRAAQSKSPVLILGESGTGKELFARAIHELSSRSKRPFVIVDTPAISDTLFESDLFGHVKGAFTGAINERRGYFEVAQGGTIFLDEIGDLSPRIQSGLLGVLQRYEIKKVGSSSTLKVDVRVIAATNKNLSKEIEKGTFREDLYYRLNVVSVELPPLGERTEDIEPLAHYFLRKYCAENGISDSAIRGITQGAINRLKTHSWKGNVRELENVIARAVTMAKGKWITDADIELKSVKSGTLPVFSKGASDTVKNRVSSSTIPIPPVVEGNDSNGFDTDAGTPADATIDADFLSIMGNNDFSIDKTARIIRESRGTVAHRLKGICFESLVRFSGDIQKASLELSRGRPELSHKVRERMEEYYSNLINVIQQYETAEDAMTECKRRFKNLKGKYVIAVEELVRRHFEKDHKI